MIEFWYIPGLMVESVPKRCNLLLPKQKCSIIWNISSGFSILPISGFNEERDQNIK